LIDFPETAEVIAEEYSHVSPERLPRIDWQFIISEDLRQASYTNTPLFKMFAKVV
jgi:hypothetical protein